MQQQRDFTTMITHQLRTPLSGIRAAAQLLAEAHYGRLPSKAQETAALIRNATERLLTQIDTYLQAMQIQEGLFEPVLTVVCVKDLIDQLVKELAPLGHLKRDTVRIRYVNIPSALLLNQETFINVFFNLLDNAIKYTDRGRISVCVRWDKKGLLVAEVADSGRGIAKTELKWIFHRSTRGSAAAGTDAPGAGFGLYIIKQLLQASNGSIEAKSKGLGKGATFIMRLPADKIDEKSSAT